MNRYIRQFEGQDVEIVYDEASKKVFFRLEDVARAAGFSEVRALRYHTKEKVREVKLKDGLYLKPRALNKIAKAATKTPGMKRFASWAVGLAGKITMREDRGNPIPAVVPAPAVVNGVPCALIQKPEPRTHFVPTTEFVRQAIAHAPVTVPVLYTLTNAATNLGMTVKELSDWLVDEGYASRYRSNNGIYFSTWFKDRSYGTYPVLNDEKGERTSRVPKLTKEGFEYVKARLDSQRETNVLSFARKEAFQEEKLEQDVDQLIIDVFKDAESGNYHTLLGTAPLYKLDQKALFRKVKRIIAEVKLKE